MSGQKVKNQAFSFSTERHVATEAARKKFDQQKQALRMSYLMANEDEGQKEAILEWESTLGDGNREW